MGNEERHVEFYFDPICPWAYQASKWIREVASVTGLEINWRFFSLHEVNRAKNSTEHDWGQSGWQWSWSLLRVGAALRSKDPTLLDLWYRELGRRFHEESDPIYVEERARAIASELGLTVEFDAALADPITDDAVRIDHQHAVDRFSIFGVPALVFHGDRCLFGPKVTPAPTGSDALKLWDIMKATSELPNVYQVRKPMTAADLKHIDDVFTPYYKARTWDTVQKSVDESSVSAGDASEEPDAEGDACRIG